ncbi:FdhF/YdeP family oxidoreductase [Rapidithrix thailandica]|uniref:FdhF/YdeP family oxidoreductase n=1 Tax=Rapidithrix thailandica TaxID=413964 RepID=A0AAW9SBY4_9BACT
MSTQSRPSKKKIEAQPPANFTGLKLSPPKEMAAGIPAILSAAKHILEEMDPFRGLSVLTKLNQQQGFDCPGCAWPDPQKRSKLGEYCENGAKAVAEEATIRRVTSDFFKKYSITNLSQQSDYWLGKQGRLTEPMLLREGSEHYEPVTWEKAFQWIARHLNSLNSPDEAVFYTSGRTSNEAAFLYQLFVRQFGTNNLPDCSNMCHESSGSGLSQTLGIGKGSVTLEDFYKAEVIMIMGQNPGTNHPRMLTALQKAKKNGCKVIIVNPLPEAGFQYFKHPQDPVQMLGKGTLLTDIFLQIKINGDVALLKAMNKILLEKEAQSPGSVLDKEFIEQHTEGFEAFTNDLKQYDLDELIRETGIEKAKILQACELLASKKRIIICWAMGLTQHKNAVGNVREIVNLLLMKGSIGKPGAGTCPVRGHSNVQGDRTMGIWEKPSQAFLERLGRNFNFIPPEHHGFDSVEAIKAMYNGSAKVFFAMGGNFLSATPDTEYTAQALQNCKLTVHVSTKLNRSHLVHGNEALILPCLGRTEEDMQKSGPQFVSVENSMGIVHKTQGRLEPASTQLLSEPAIVARLAKATLGYQTSVNWDEMTHNYDAIRDAIEAVIPGFEHYNQKVRQENGFYLPNCARDRKFNTLNGKAQFTINSCSSIRLLADEYLMMTIRSHDQYNTTIYGLNDRYRGIYNERRVILMHPEDIKSAQLSPEQIVDLYSYYDNEERIARKFIVVPYPIPKQCVATYFPEANVLVPVNSTAEISNTPTSKSVVIKIKTALTD